MILVVALRFGTHLSALLERGSDEALLLAVFGLTLLVGGLAQELEVSAAIGAFLVGLALSGPVQHRAGQPGRARCATCSPPCSSCSSRSRSIPATSSARCCPAPRWRSWPAAASCSPAGSPPAGPASAGAGRLRAGSALIARGEFSIVIASLGAAGRRRGPRRRRRRLRADHGHRRPAAGQVLRSADPGGDALPAGPDTGILRAPPVVGRLRHRVLRASLSRSRKVSKSVRNRPPSTASSSRLGRRPRPRRSPRRG